MDKPSYLNFDKTKYAWKPDVDYRANPELYRVGKGEQGVLICEPYKGELVPLWRFKTPEIATESSKAIYKKFLAYLRQGDFVGADMARKFLQMGFTRARRYTNYKGGRKYDPETSTARKGYGRPGEGGVGADLLRRLEEGRGEARLRPDEGRVEGEVRVRPLVLS